MSVRKSLAAVLVTAVAGSTVALTAGPASAAYAPNATTDSKTSGVVSADLIGAGSDTSEMALKLLAGAWNSGAKAGYGQTFDIATFGALGGGDLPAPVVVDGTGQPLARPNGSGPGRATLYGTGRASEVDFARSSGAPSPQNYSDGMRSIPFALDTVVPTVAGGNSHSANLSLADLQAIYVTCTKTTWADGTAIHPYIPKQGSGTESFFKTKVVPAGQTYGACVKDHTNDADPAGSFVQEHDAGLFAIDALALVPFSKGRAALAGTVKDISTNVDPATSTAFKRNLYNVVRAEEASRADIQAVFGETGFVCSAAAHDLIAQAGFEQLATAALGGDCGKVMSAASSNFTLNAVTTPAVTVTGAGNPGAVNLTAKVTSSPTAVGSVTFTEGATVLASNVKVVSGQAVTTPLALAAGSHTIKAVFTPGQSNFQTAQTTATVTVVAATAPDTAGCDTATAKVAKAKKALKKAKKAHKPAATVKKLTKKVKKAKQAQTAACA